MDSSDNVSQSSSYLTRDQEHRIMVSALRQVIISNSESDTSSSHLVVGETLPPLEAGPCPLCGVTGCHGCAFRRGHEGIKKEKKHKGVRKKPSEIWDPSLRVKRWLGTFPTAEMAAKAYEETKAELVRRRSTPHGTNKGE